jgi:hypothetical protein
MRAAAAFLLKFYACLAVVAACALHPGVAMAKDAKLAVVPLADRHHPFFGVAVQNLVEKPLAHDLTLVPPSAVKKAMKRAHLVGAAAHSPRHLVALGRALGATHVATIDVRGRGKATLSHVLVIEVATGRAVLSKRYPLPRAVLNVPIAKRMAGAIVAKVAPAETGEAEAPPPGAVAEGSVDGDKKATGDFAFPGAGDKDSPGKSGADDKATGDEVADANDKDEKDDKDAHKSAGEDDNTDSALRRNARLATGLTFMQRTGHLNAPRKLTYATPCYCGTNNNANPLFPAYRLEGEIFPGGLLSDSGAWYTNLGLTFGFGVTAVKSYTSASPTSNVVNPNTAISSTVLDIRVAAAYRLMWWDAPLAPDTFIQVGLDHFSFPLGNAAFPGVTYTSPFFGLDFHIPLMDHLMVMVDGTYMFVVSPGNDAGKLLGTKKSGQGFSFGGGLRTGWDRYQLNLTAHYEHFSVNYTGATSLKNTPVKDGTVVQWDNAGLTDALLKLMLTVGVVF